MRGRQRHDGGVAAPERAALHRGAAEAALARSLTQASRRPCAGDPSSRHLRLRLVRLGAAARSQPLSGRSFIEAPTSPSTRRNSPRGGRSRPLRGRPFIEGSALTARPPHTGATATAHADQMALPWPRNRARPGRSTSGNTPAPVEHQMGPVYTPASMSHASPMADGKNCATVFIQRSPGMSMMSTMAKRRATRSRSPAWAITVTRLSSASAWPSGSVMVRARASARSRSPAWAIR